jgi:hypothetical protein
MAARALERLSWVVVPLALLGYGLCLTARLVRPKGRQELVDA